ncbi:hypothetical protein BJX99DRAFT_237663 [Aspergillus californicus]
MTHKRENQSSPSSGPSRPTKLRRSGPNAAISPATIPGPSAAADTVEPTLGVSGLPPFPVWILSTTSATALIAIRPGRCPFYSQSCRSASGKTR